jgi:predicted alpha/beta superfamily hydrolase
MGRAGLMTMLAWLGGGVVFGGVLKEVEFTLTRDVGFGNETCVIGPHPALGGNDPLKAPKLSWSEGNVWRGKIGLPAGAVITHRFIKRDFKTSIWGNATNAEALTGNLTVVVPSHVAAPWTGKTIFLHSSWGQANVFHRDLTNGGDWTTTPMRRVGAGRSSGEYLYRADGVAANGAELEFVFNDGGLNWLNAPAPPSNPAQGAAPAIPAPYQGLTGPFNFRTRLDVFFVQGQQVFNYKPPADPWSANTLFRDIGSTAANVPGRPIRIYLPRCYEQNPWKRYPVIYFHDGQNVPFPGGDFGTWDAERIAHYEISQGRMRECIIVSIPNGNAYGSNRLEEYLPDGDSIVYSGGNYDGKASAYAKFLLDNIVPTLDFNFRTLVGAANTLTAGSSMGGLISDYLGTKHPDRFGTVGVFSPAYWAADNYMASRAIPSKKPRVFLSMGTAESSTGESSSNIYWRDAVDSYSRYISAGHAANRDILFAGVAGGQHNEPAWSRLLPTFYSFALDPRLEANPLLLEHYPPALALGSAEPSGALELRLLRHLGFNDRLQESENLKLWNTSTLPAVAELWDESVMPVPAGPARRFWRIQSEIP